MCLHVVILENRNNKIDYCSLFLSFHWDISLQIVIFKTSWPISINLDTNHPLVKEIQILHMKRQFHFKGKVRVIKNAKYGWAHLRLSPS